MHAQALNLPFMYRMILAQCTMHSVFKLHTSVTLLLLWDVLRRRVVYAFMLIQNIRHAIERVGWWSVSEWSTSKVSALHLACCLWFQTWCVLWQLATLLMDSWGPSIYDVHKKIKVFYSSPPINVLPCMTDPLPLWRSTYQLQEIYITLLKQWPWRPTTEILLIWL